MHDPKDTEDWRRDVGDVLDDVDDGRDEPEAEDTHPPILSSDGAPNCAEGWEIVRQQADSVVAACILLGPDYRAFGIEQIEIDGREDPRDYALHHVLWGHRWWRQLTRYARERRGPLKRFSDRIAGREMFEVF
mgnify:CR=1 FL=1